jgi:hypothetical protein
MRDDGGMAATRSTPPSYADALVLELDAIETEYASVLDRSDVLNLDLNRQGSGMVFIGYPSWGWTSSDALGETARMKLLGRLRDLRRLRPTGAMAGATLRRRDRAGVRFGSASCSAVGGRCSSERTGSIAGRRDQSPGRGGHQRID